MKKLIIHPDLEKFLREEKILTVFKKNVKASDWSLKDPNVFKEIENGDKDAITDAFQWNKSLISAKAKAKVPHTYPFSFWSKLSEKWIKRVERKMYGVTP